VESRLAHFADPNAFVFDAVIPLANGAPGDSTGLGNVPRNCIIGPPQKNMDFTLGKTFHLTERQSLRFRTDFFNLFNHPSFANRVGARRSEQQLFCANHLGSGHAAADPVLFEVLVLTCPNTARGREG
jgi:hypothetical protein